MFAALALAVLSGAPAAACADFARRVAEPVAIAVRPVTAQQLMGVDDPRETSPLPVRSPIRIGELDYRGYGIDIRSDDPRFAAIRIDQQRGLHHRCGQAVVGPSGWNAFDSDLASYTLRFEPVRGTVQAHPGAATAAQTGAVPVLDGHEAGPSWPVQAGGRRFFLGVMHPAGSAERSVIVAFAARSGRMPARVLARLPMHIDGFTVLPDLHRPVQLLSLAARSPDGALRQIVLEMSDETRAAIAAGLTG